MSTARLQIDLRASIDPGEILTALGVKSEQDAFDAGAALGWMHGLSYVGKMLLAVMADPDCAEQPAALVLGEVAKEVRRLSREGLI